MKDGKLADEDEEEHEDADDGKHPWKIG